MLPIYGSMRAIPDELIEAARDLGATPFRAARDIVLPLCERGINVAFLFSFLISAGDYVTPRFVGGGASMMGHFIETQFSFGFNWPMGSAMSFTLLAASLLVVLACAGFAPADRACAHEPFYSQAMCVAGVHRRHARLS